MKCNYCKGRCIKKGRYKQTQKYRCKDCQKYQRSTYRYQQYDSKVNNQIALLNNEGLGISSIGRILRMPKTTVQRRLLIASSKISARAYTETGQEYEVDELHTYIGKNHFSCYTYIIYAINRSTRKVIDYVIGSRSKENIGRLVNKLMKLSPKKIFTDRLSTYACLIPKSIHCTFLYKTNRIERKNLTLRTHLKRLSRKTICFSRSNVMLEACFRLYIWQ